MFDNEDKFNDIEVLMYETMRQIMVELSMIDINELYNYNCISHLWAVDWVLNDSW